MDKIKVGIEVTDNWTRGDFRQFVMSISKNTAYELYIISNDDISAYIVAAGVVLGLPTDRVVITNFTDDKIDAITLNGIQIYLENLKYVADRIDYETDCYGIFVNEIPDRFQAQPTYIVDFDRAVVQIIKDNCEGIEAQEE